jgi:hypothetical protein
MLLLMTQNKTNVVHKKTLKESDVKEIVKAAEEFGFLGFDSDGRLFVFASPVSRTAVVCSSDIVPERLANVLGDRSVAKIVSKNAVKVPILPKFTTIGLQILFIINISNFNL